MSELREAAQQALKLLEDLNNTNSYWWQEVADDTVDNLEPCISALRAALSEHHSGEATEMVEEYDPDSRTISVCPVTTSPKREWVGLTEEEIETMELPPSGTATVR